MLFRSKIRLHKIIRLNIIFISLTICQTAFSTKTDRVIEFIHIDSKHNPDLNRYGIDFRSKIIESVLKLKTPVFNKNTGMILSRDSIEYRLTYEEVVYEFGDEVYRSYFYGRDFNKIGIESIIHKKDKQYISRQAVHFYTDETYRFSITYKDFENIISKADYLIARNQNGPYWKNNIFLTHGDYMVDWYDFHKEIIQNISKTIIQVIDPKDKTIIENQNVLQLLDTSKNTSCCQFYNNQTIEQNSFGYEMYNDPRLWGINDRYEFSPNKELLTQNNSTHESYKLLDYFNKGLYEVSSKAQIKSKKKDHKSTFIDLSAIQPYKEKIECLFSEAILTSYNQNKLFEIYPSFMKDLVNYSLDGKLTSYYNDSLTSHGTIDELKLILTNPQKTYEGYFDYIDYHIGDTIQLNKNIYTTQNNINKKRAYDDWIDPYYSSVSIKQADGSFLPVTSQDEFDSTEWMKIENPPVTYFDFDEIEDLECNFIMSFDEDGTNLHYELQSITIFISAIATGNTRGLQIPIATFDWKEVKSLFSNNDFVKAMEQRNYFSYYLKSTLVKPSE